MTNVLVVYYSATGNTAAMAHALAAGAESVGASVRVRRVAETAPRSAVDANPRWRAYLESVTDELADLTDLGWADGIALGSPTRFGGAASQLKGFLDTTGPMWMRGELIDKVGTSFTSASTAHGGLESTILAMNNVLYHWGSLVMPLGYLDRHITKVTGNPYGTSWVSRSGSAPDDDCLLAARMQGARLARCAGALASALPVHSSQTTSPLGAMS
jgi:NAD(P)H dehydrogenase (quinone)